MRRAAILVLAAACGAGPEGRAASASETDPDPVTTLFTRYAQAMNDHALAGTAGYFAPRYLESIPSGSRIVSNDDEHRDALRAEDAYLHVTLGLTSARLASLDTTPLGDHHALVRVRLAVTFARTRDRVTELPRTYVVDRTTPRAPFVTGVVVETDEPATFHALGLF